MSNIGKFRSSPVSVKPQGKDAFLEGSALVSRDLADQGLAGQLADARVAIEEAENAFYRMLNVKLSKRQHTELKLLSVHTGKPMQQFVIELIDELLKRNKNTIRR